MASQPIDNSVLALIPNGAVRVKVTDPKGKTYWRTLSNLLPTDKLVINPATGMALCMMHEIGRRPGYRKNKSPPPPSPPKKKNGFKSQAQPPVAGAPAPGSEPIPDSLREKRRAIKKDRLVRSVGKGADSPDILNIVVRELAEEIAALKFERVQEEKKGGDNESSQVSVKRVQALKTLGETWLRRREQLAGTELDIDSPAFQTLFKFISDTFAQALVNSNIRAEVIEVVFANFSKLLTDDWKAEAKNKVKGS